MRNIIVNRAAVAGLAALIAAATAGAAFAGGQGHAGGPGGAPGGQPQVHTREQARSEIAEREQLGLPAEAGLMTMEQLQARLRAEGYGDISEIEREGMRYEVAVRNQAGMRTKLHLDSVSGAILSVEQDD